MPGTTTGWNNWKPTPTTTQWNSWKPTPTTTTQWNGQCTSREQLVYECKEKRGRWAWTCTDPGLLSAQEVCEESNHIMNADGDCVELCSK